ncbi:unnamed protein product [Penicillium pancosmium]
MAFPHVIAQFTTFMAGLLKRVLSWTWGRSLTPSSSSTVIHTPQTPAREYSSAVPHSTSANPESPPLPHFMERAITRVREAIQHLFRATRPNDAISPYETSGDEASDVPTDGWFFKEATYSRERINEWRKKVKPVLIGVIHEEDEPYQDGSAIL